MDTEKPPSPKEGRIGGLDSVRGLAVAMVLLGHAGLADAAPVGVTVFFVLSGYLITGLLREDRRLVPFYRRRFARLAPALIVVMSVVSMVSLARGDWNTLAGAVASLTYVTNWLPVDQLGAMGHTWSLAVEEQFYLLWPLLFFLPRKWILAVAITGAGVVIALRLGLETGITEYRTIFRADALLIGCALAFLRPSRWATVPGAILVLIATFAFPIDGYTLAAFGAVGLVAGARFLPSLPPLDRLGRVSYGVYLWHRPLFLWFGPMFGIVLAILVAEVSFRLIEEPLRVRWAYQPAPSLR